MVTQRRSQKNITSSDKVLTVEAETPKPDQALKTDTEQSQQRERALQETIDQLRAQIQDHDAIVQHLQANLDEAQHTALRLAESNQTLIDENKQLRTELTHVQPLKSELEKAQQAAVSLAESNQSLMDENKALKEKQVTVQKAELAKAQSESDMRSQQEMIRKRQAITLAHPVFPNPSESEKNADQDLGWFD